MKLHPRTMPVRMATLELKTQLDNYQQQHDLTDVEMHRALLEYMTDVSKGWLREERHPGETDRKADEE